MTSETPQTAGAAGEKRGDILFLAKDAGLRQDVHDLGMIVGQLLEEQGGRALLDRVEQARRAAIDAREGDPEAGQRLAALLAALPAGDAETFIRAFSTYFQAVNSAELVHRIRRRRAYLREGRNRQPGGFEDTLFDLRDAGVTLAEISAVLADR
ncbi:MAG: phosphoenolpyruvate carboxylase, partial [Gammaproteobacteria bacterium]|nr:phosphoenolpyruvate carboxylase [Gammaproteobacteria bacterium]